MSSRAEKEKRQKDSRKGGKFFPALCGFTGTLLILLVAVILIPFVIPRVFGYEVYNIVSGSMEPSVPRGSLVFVRPTDWSEIRTDDVIAFDRGGGVVTHRVVEIRAGDMEFITKGDANEEKDILPVTSSELIGKVEKHIPFAGMLAAQLSSWQGKLCLLSLAAAGLLLRLAAEQKRKNG